MLRPDGEHFYRKTTENGSFQSVESRGHRQTYLARVFFQIALLPSAEGGGKNGKNESAQQKEPTKKNQEVQTFGGNGKPGGSWFGVATRTGTAVQRSEGEVQASCLKMTSKGAQSGDQQVYICAAIDVY